MLSRRDWLAMVAGGIALGALGRPASALSRGMVEVKVYKSPTCGCCGKWVTHLRDHGFTVEVEDVADIAAIKARHGVPGSLSSCHTALVEGYVVEGHVPAGDIRRLLEERPEALGIAAPGMPVGSPGMEVGDRKDPYDVVAFDRAGKSWIFASHR